jgi:hypothetical protein
MAHGTMFNDDVVINVRGFTGRNRSGCRIGAFTSSSDPGKSKHTDCEHVMVDEEFLQDGPYVEYGG